VTETHVACALCMGRIKRPLAQVVADLVRGQSSIGSEHVARSLRDGERVSERLDHVSATEPDQTRGAGEALVFVWLEPANAARRTAAPVGLLTPAELSAEASCPLAEARFFYGQGLLHLLADSGETRAAAWWEGQPGQPPAWLTAAISLADANFKDNFKDAQECASSTTAAAPANGNGRGLLRKERPILLSHVRSERGLRHVGQGIGDNVQAVEYFQDGQLRWWRIQRHG